jgi:hypothetical protein
VGWLGFGHSGSSPSPFDALDGHRLAGPSGSHPLHDIDAAMLLRPMRGPIAGAIELETPNPLVGGVISGRIQVQATEDLQARGAGLRLVGLRLVEERKSRTHRSPNGHTTTESWVEANGSLFVVEPFGETRVPAMLGAGERWETAIRVPAPPLGPPSAHLGEAILAWALEVRWDRPWSEDPVLAALVEVEQHPDLLRAGVGRQGGASLLETIDVDGARIMIESGLPGRIGTPIQVRTAWPSAPHGRGARLELHRRTSAPNGETGIVASAALDLASLQSGAATAQLLLPLGLSPSFDGAGLQLDYVLRVVVDRPFQPDASVERPIGLA